MNAIAQHVPSFVDTGGPPERAEFSTLEELLDVHFLKEWTNHPKFHQFSWSDAGRQYLLMVEFDRGNEWWVAGTLDKPVEGLPEWIAPL